MPRFRYNAIDADGKRTSGEMDADDVAEVNQRLEEGGLQAESVELIADAPAEEAKPKEKESKGRGARRLPARDFRKLSAHLGDLTESGLPLVQGLAALAEELPSSRYRRGLRSIVAHLRAGGDLASVLEHHGAPAELQALITAGARSGHTAELLGRYAAQARQVSEIKSRAALALAYPLLILLFTTVLMTGILVLIVPSFRSIFEDFGIELPGLTRALIGISDLVVNHGIWLAAGFITLAGVICIVALFVLDGVTRRQIICMVPVLGRMARYSSLARFSHLLGILVENGVPLPDALVLAGDSSGDALVQSAGWMIAADVEAGEPLDRAAYNTPAMPATLIEAMGWHKQPEVFADTLRALSEMYEARARSQVGLIAALWQPILVVALGFTIGLTVIALFLPLIKLLNDLA